jgi:DNA-binding NarL/FixJ family response regulator
MSDVFILSGAPGRRALLQTILNKEPAIHVVGIAPTFPFLRSLMNDVDGDLAIIEMPSASPSDIEWTVELLESVPLVILTTVSNASLFAHMVRTERGGMLRSDASPEQIVHGVKAVMAGLLTFDSSLIPHSETTQEPAEALTARENEVLTLLAEGLSNREIAARLHISEHTIKFHIRSILGKLGASSRTEAVTRGLRSGLIEL